MAENSKNKTVERVHELFREYSNYRDSWATHVQEDREYRLGRQWSEAQVEKLKTRGHSPIVVNRIHPAVETAKALLTANRPQFRVSPREDSDNKVAQVVNGMLEYIFDISDGITVMRSVIDDYYVSGMGLVLVYQDPLADDGKGEIKIKDIDPLDVYIDPNSRSRFCDDAEKIIISRLFTKEQAIRMYPIYKNSINNAMGSFDSDRPTTDRAGDNDAVVFPEEITSDDNEKYVRGYECYEKIPVKMVRVNEKFSGKEHVFTIEEFEEYINKPAAVVNGQVVEDMNMLNQMQQQGVEFHISNFKDFMDKGMIEVVESIMIRVKQIVVVGDALLYERMMPISDYPIIPFMNLHARTPFPQSDVRMVKGLQEYINKTRSLIIAHATTSTNTKILVPEGSVDMKTFENKWAQPGVAIPYDPTDGAPVPVQPLALPSALYQNEQTAKSDIDHELGLFEMMQGNSGAAPQTYKATIAIDEFGQRRIKSKLADIEAGLKRVGEVAIPLMQQLYKTEKIVRVVQPNNSINEYVINKKLIDDKTGEIQVFNDITVGKYDVIVVTGATLPTNRYAQLELYMDAYKNGIVDKQEVLKKTEVFDMEGVLERTDIVAGLQGQVQQQQEEIKKLEGDLQTFERENVHLKQRVETEKFKTQLNKQANKVQASTTLYEKRLDDVLATVREQMREEKKKELTSSSKSSSKKGKR